LGCIDEGFAEGFVAFVSADAVLLAQVFDFDYGVRHEINLSQSTQGHRV